MLVMFSRATFSCAALLLSVPFLQGAFQINIDYSGNTPFTPAQRAIIDSAKDTWENIITGYQAGVALGAFEMEMISDTIDGRGDYIGFAVPTTTVEQGGFTFNTSGQIVFDAADISVFEANDALWDLTLHEMGHILGFGTTWVENGVYVLNSGEYTGAFGVAAYQREYNQPDALFVPIELDGGMGTANNHWDERNGGNAATGIVNSMGRDLRYEVMTGWLDTPVYISETTIQSLRDIGFTVIPEPHTYQIVFGVLCIVVIAYRSNLTSFARRY